MYEFIETALKGYKFPDNDSFAVAGSLCIAYYGIYIKVDFPMQEKTERWLQLSRQAAEEQDPGKFMEIIKELNNLLEEKEQRLGIIRSEQRKKSA